MNALFRIGVRNALITNSAHTTLRRSVVSQPTFSPIRYLATRPRISKTHSAGPQASRDLLSKHTDPPPAQEEQGQSRNDNDGGPEPSYWRSSYKLSLLFTFQFFIIGHFIINHFYSLTWPYGASMLPTIYLSGECVLISRHYANGRDIRVGDVVCAGHPIFPHGNGIIKRVLGMPGDFVMDGIFEDGEPRMVKVPRGHCWLAGDNAGFSRDSRIFGPVPLGLVIGKVAWRVWPWDRFGRIENSMEEVDEWEAAPP